MTTNHTDVPKLVVFDLVATLTDAGPRYAAAYIRMCHAYNVTPPAQDDILAALGDKNLKQIIAEFTPDLPAEKIDQFMDDCNNACDVMLNDQSWHESLYPDVRFALNALRDSGFMLGVYTGTREDAMVAQLKHHNVAHAFDPRFMHGKDNDRDGMIDSHALKAVQLESIANAYRLAMRDMTGVNLTDVELRARILVVGDSAADRRAAEKAGLDFVLFSPRGAADAGNGAQFARFFELPALVTARMTGGRGGAAPRKPGGMTL